LTASALTLAAVSNPHNAFVASGPSTHAVALPLSSMSSKLLPSEAGRFTLRPQAASSRLWEWSHMHQAGGMFLKFIGCTGLLIASLGRAARAQRSQNGHEAVRCCAIASVQLSMPAMTAQLSTPTMKKDSVEGRSSSPGSITIAPVPPTMASALEIVAPAIGHSAPQVVAQRLRYPRAARNISRQRRKAGRSRTMFATASSKGATHRSTRRHIGARLSAHSPAHAVAAAAYDPSRVRTQIQVGLKIWNRLRTASGRESKTPSASKVSTAGTRTSMTIQLCRRLLRR